MSETFRVFTLILTPDYQLKLFVFKFNETLMKLIGLCARLQLLKTFRLRLRQNERHEQCQIIANHG